MALAWQSWKGQTGRDSYAPQRACNKKGRGAATSGNRIERSVLGDLAPLPASRGEAGSGRQGHDDAKMAAATGRLRADISRAHRAGGG